MISGTTPNHQTEDLFVLKHNTATGLQRMVVQAYRAKRALRLK
jgi:hypothetical protein